MRFLYLNVLQRRSRPVGRGGSRGFERTHLLTSKRFYIHLQTVHFSYPTICPLVSLLLRITAVQTSLVAATVPGCASSFMGEHVYSPAMTRVITCVNKWLVLAVESCPSSEFTPCTCCSANLSTFSREKFEISWPSKCIHRQLKFGCNTRRAK